MVLDALQHSFVFDGRGGWGGDNSYFCDCRRIESDAKFPDCLSQIAVNSYFEKKLKMMPDLRIALARLPSKVMPDCQSAFAYG